MFRKGWNPPHTPAHPRSHPRTPRSLATLPSGPQVQDLVSTLYTVRNVDFAKLQAGDMFHFRVFVYNILHPQFCSASRTAASLAAPLAAPIGQQCLVEEKAGSRGGVADGWAGGRTGR